MAKNVECSINVDANELIKQIGSISNRSSYSEQYLDNNQCRWISCQYDGILN